MEPEDVAAARRRLVEVCNACPHPLMAFIERSFGPMRAIHAAAERMVESLRPDRMPLFTEPPSHVNRPADRIAFRTAEALGTVFMNTAALARVDFN